MKLPVRSGADIRLADALDAPGCPLCRERDRVMAASLGSILSESVNDVPFRLALDEGRGFCPAHARAVLDADRRDSGTLGAAILLRATLGIRLRELEAAHAAGGRARSRRLREAATPPACLLCQRVARTDADLVESLGRLIDEPAWADAVAAAALCHAHLLALAARRAPSPAWLAVEDRQLARLRALADDLAGFAHASSHDRRHLMTEAHRASVDATADLLDGKGATRKARARRPAP
jgi:hypothetical protein